MFTVRRDDTNEHWIAVCETTGCEFDTSEDVGKPWAMVEPRFLYRLRQHKWHIASGEFSTHRTALKPAPDFIAPFLLEFNPTPSDDVRITCTGCGDIHAVERYTFGYLLISEAARHMAECAIAADAAGLRKRWLEEYR